MNSKWLWRILTAAAVIFAAGISGSWLGEQMRAPLPVWWGWFGAVIAGVAVFGGVSLAVQGERAGAYAAIIGVTADAVLSMAFFGETHPLYIALPLGLFPALIAVVGGFVEAKSEQHYAQTEIKIENAKWGREQKAREREMKIKFDYELEMAKLTAQPALTALADRADGHDRSMTVSQRPRPDKAEFDLWLTGHPSATGADVAAAFGMSERTGRRWLEAAREESQ